METSASIARGNGWVVGDELVGADRYGRVVIEITAIGEESVLAKKTKRGRTPTNGRETMWWLGSRDWVLVASSRDDRRDPIAVDIYHRAGDDAFISGVNGAVTVEALQEIETTIVGDIARTDGDGVYTYDCTWDTGQQGEFGRYEIEPYWHCEQSGFVPDPPIPHDILGDA